LEQWESRLLLRSLPGVPGRCKAATVDDDSRLEPINDDDLRDLEDSELKFVPVSIQQLARAVTQVESCEKCNSGAEIPFDWILRAFVDAKDYVDYILPAHGLCPKCRSEIHEKTLVQPVGDSDAANWI